MASYKLAFKPSAIKELASIPSRKEREKIKQRISALPENPRTIAGARKLSVGKSLYRLRQGDYRINYRVYEGEGIITITRIRHRKDAYRGEFH